MTGCVDQKREFSEKDFIGATKMFCQKLNFRGSPLKSNSFILYYSKQASIGNIGQYVYAPWLQERKIGEAHLYETSDAIELDDRLIFLLKSLEQRPDLHISIDRKSLVANMDKDVMSCQIMSDEALAIKKEELVKEHEEINSRLMKENKI